MAEFISTFTTGFSKIVEERLPRELPGASVVQAWDGLIRYRYEGEPAAIKDVVFLNNTFAVLQAFRGPDLDFPQMVRATCKGRHRFPISEGTYRVRFSRGNQFVGVEKSLAANAERHVEQCSRLKPDRLSPQTELWYLIRSEGVGFYCQLLFRRETTEKDLARGELRPEFAYLLCGCAEPEPDAVVCDPFCGYGAIPRQLLKRFPVGKVFASDLDPERVDALRRQSWAGDGRLSLAAADALDLKHLPDESADAAITDPPWGYYEDVGEIGPFYEKMLAELKRVVKSGGRLTVLTARKQELETAAERAGLTLEQRVDTLVNGKKAAVFVLKKER